MFSLISNKTDHKLTDVQLEIFGTREELLPFLSVNRTL